MKNPTTHSNSTYQEPIPLTATANTEKKWQCRWATAHDQDAFLSLFQSAFDQTMPASLWAWKYSSQNKHGIFAHVNGKVVAYYGGIPRGFSLNGKTVSAVQICDIMVAPNMRGILTRRGPFMQTADTFLSARIGQDKTHRFAFGFPSDRHARLGEKSGWYARTDTFLEATWPVTARLPFWLKATPLTEDRHELVDNLWQAMQASLPNHLLPIKDSLFFKWRYKNHPNRNYQSFVVSWRATNNVIGIVTLHDHGLDIGIEIMDLFAPASKLKTLHIAAQDICMEIGHSRLFSWMTPAILTYLPQSATQSEISGVYVTPDFKHTADQQQLHWWLMGGDTDFK